MNNDYYDKREMEELSKEDADKIADGLNAGAGVLTAIGAVVVAIAALAKFFSNDD